MSELLAKLVAGGKVIGADVTIYDPELDPETRHAGPIVECLAGGFAYNLGKVRDDGR